MDHKIRTRIKELFEVSGQAIKIGEDHLQKQKKPTPDHLIEAIATNRAAIALIAGQIETLHQMHVGLERANLELEDSIKESHEELLEAISKTKNWQMQDPKWKEPLDGK